jgi:hypothetical protein
VQRGGWERSSGEPITLIRTQEVTVALVAEVGKVVIDGEMTRLLIRN